MGKIIQEFLNFALELNGNEELAVDGIVGNKTRSMINRFKEKLKSKFQELNYEYSNEYNLIGYRTNDFYTDRFTDYLILDLPNDLKVYRFSTKPGVSSVFKRISMWVMGMNGVAVLKEDQYKNLWKLNTGWWSGRPFLHQINPCTVYRDNNTNGYIDRALRQIGVFGINGHTWIGFNFNIVGNLSEGCQVAVESEWLRFLNDLKDSDGIVTYTLLNHNQFIGKINHYT